MGHPPSEFRAEFQNEDDTWGLMVDKVSFLAGQDDVCELLWPERALVGHSIKPQTWMFGTLKSPEICH